MRALSTKLRRDLWRMRGQVITITLILASGIAAYVCLSGAHRALARSRDAYYAQYAFPDVFVHLERAPDAVASRLREIDGVTSLETRLVEGASFRLAGEERAQPGRAISIEPGSRAEANLVLRAGRLLDPARDDEVLLLESFARGANLAPGDELDVVIAGHELDLRVVGLVLSPEWVFPMEGGMMPGDFGVVWMTRDALASATGKHGAFDSVTFRLTPSADRREVIEAIDRELARWGGGGAFGRDKQVSNRAVSNELDQLESMATKIPAVFLLVAMFLLNVVLSRIVHLQREQLAVLRALGYTRGALARHVLAFASVITVGGVVVGLGLGRWFAGAITKLYATFFHFPVLEAGLDATIVGVSVLVAIVAAIGGAMTAAWRVVRLAPAEAMRAPAPARYRRGLLSRLGLARVAGPMGRMIVRDLERRPVLTGLSVAGIAFAGGIVVLGRFSVDAMDHLMDVVLARALREDAAVTLARPVPRAELAWFRHAPGVLAAEPVHMVPVRLHARARSRDVPLTAWPRDAEMRQVLDGRSRPRPLPPEGVMLTALLGERLGVGVGDTVVAERLDGSHARIPLTVAALVDERMGLNAYMDLDALADALDEEPRMSTVLLRVDRAERDRLHGYLATVPGVMMVMEPRGIREAFDAQSGQFMLVWTLIVVVFGSVIAVGVVFNTARVMLSERSRDLATLRVLGFTRDEVAIVLLGQLAVQVVLALPIGMLFGWLMAASLMQSADPEQFRFPVITSPATFAFASLVVLGSAIATAVVVRRRLDRTDIVSALKARD